MVARILERSQVDVHRIHAINRASTYYTCRFSLFFIGKWHMILYNSIHTSKTQHRDSDTAQCIVTQLSLSQSCEEFSQQRLGKIIRRKTLLSLRIFFWCNNIIGKNNVRVLHFSNSLFFIFALFVLALFDSPFLRSIALFDYI